MNTSVQQQLNLPPMDQVGFVYKDLDAAIASVLAAGGARLTEPGDIPGVGVHAYCADPEGTVFGLLQSIGQPG